MEFRDDNDEDVAATAYEILNALQDAGAKLVCIDFDATFVSIHTGGTWRNSARQLSIHVRPIFRHLIPLVAVSGIQVAVVTFSPQVELIQDVMRLCFPLTIADSIVIRGDDESWSVTRGNFTSFALDNIDDLCFDSTHKLPYIVSAAVAAGRRSDKNIRNFETVLIDDDHNNIHMATKHGISAIRYCPEESDAKMLCESIKNLHISGCSVRTPQRKSGFRQDDCIDTPISKYSNKEQDLNNGRLPTFPKFTPSPVMKFKCEPVSRRSRPKCPQKLRHTGIVPYPCET